MESAGGKGVGIVLIEGVLAGDSIGISGGKLEIIERIKFIVEITFNNISYLCG